MPIIVSKANDDDTRRAFDLARNGKRDDDWALWRFKTQRRARSVQNVTLRCCHQQSARQPSAHAESFIDVVSLKDYTAGGQARDRFVKTVGDALVDIGFFALADHGVDMTLIDRAYQLAEDFFMRPDAEKRRYEDLKLKGQRGFTSFGREQAKDAKVVARKTGKSQRLTLRS